MPEDNQFKIKITTTADLGGANAAEKALNRQGDAAKTASEQLAKLAESSKKAQAELADSGKSSGFLSKPGDLAGGKLGGIVSTLLGVGTAFGGAKKALDEFAQSEENIARLDAALAQTGQLSDATRERFQELASELEKTTGIADEKWAAVLARLVQFGATAGDIEKHAEAVKNLAGLMGGDIQEAAGAVSRALAGNFTMFSRLGIKVDEHGTQVEKLNQLYAELAQRGGGQLEARANTLFGKFEALKNGISNFFEAIGRWIAQSGILQTILFGLATSFAWLADNLGGLVPKVDGVANAAKRTVQPFGESAQAANKLAEAQGAVKTAADNAKTSIDNEVKSLKELQSEADLMDDAEMAKDLALMTERHQKFNTPKSQGIIEEAAIRRHYAGKKFLRSQAAHEETIDLRKSELEETFSGEQKLDRQIEDQKKVIAAAEAKRLGQDLVIKQAEARQRVADARQALFEGKDVPGYFPPGSLTEHDRDKAAVQNNSTVKVALIDAVTDALRNARSVDAEVAAERARRQPIVAASPRPPGTVEAEAFKLEELQAKRKTLREVNELKRPGIDAEISEERRKQIGEKNRFGVERYTEEIKTRTQLHGAEREESKPGAAADVKAKEAREAAKLVATNIDQLTGDLKGGWLDVLKVVKALLGETRSMRREVEDLDARVKDMRML